MGGKMSCQTISWIAAVALGLLVGYALWSLGWFLALIGALVTVALLGWVFNLLCDESATGRRAPEQREDPATPSAGPAAAATGAGAASVGAARPVATEPTPEAAPPPREEARPPADEQRTGQGPRPEHDNPSPGETAHWSGAVPPRTEASEAEAPAGRGPSGLKPSAEPREEATLRDNVGAWRYEDHGAGTKGAKTNKSD